MQKTKILGIGAIVGLLFLTVAFIAAQTHQPSTGNNNPLEVEFFICNTYDVPHVAPIIKELENRGIQATSFVKKPKTAFKSDEKKNELVTHYNNVLNIAHEYGLAVQDENNYNADVALTSQVSNQVRHYKHMKVKIGYGSAPKIKDNHQTPEYLEGFDGFLVHGQFDVDNYAHAFEKDRLKIMGLPKYESFFKNPPNKEALKRKWNLLTDKKIIVYLPTWDGDASIDTFEQAITALKDEYFIVCKPHNNTFRYDNNKPHREKLARMSTHLIDSSMSLGELAITADLLLTDIKSGASTESIYLTQGNTPWIGLTPTSPSEYYPAVVAAGPVLNDPTQLKATIELVLKNDTYKPARLALNHYYCSNPSGPTLAAKDAADAIIEFAHMQPLNQDYPYFWKKVERSINKRVLKIKDFFNRLP